MASTRKTTRPFRASLRVRRYANSTPTLRTIDGEMTYPDGRGDPTGVLHALHVLLVENTADLYSIDSLTITLSPGE